MKGHAALPHLDDVGRMGEKMARVVEQHIADPAAENHSEQNMVQQAVDGSRGQGRFGAGRLASQDPVPGKQPANIGERIPADAEAAEIDQERIKLGKDDGAGHAASLLLVDRRPCAGTPHYRIHRRRGIGKHGKMP